MAAEYNASATKYLFWYLETKETAKLLSGYSEEEIRSIVIDDNLYQQKDKARRINEYGCIKSRLDAIPEDLRKMIVTSDIETSKLIVFISCMASDKLLFDFMYEVYRNKIFYGEKNLTDADFNIFFKDKSEQNDKVATISDASRAKLKQVYSKFMFEAGLITGKITEKTIRKAYIDPDVKYILQSKGMDRYLVAVTGER